MGRQSQSTHTLPDGNVVGYSLTDRNGGYRVRFVGPDGNRIERATGRTTKGDARDAAKNIINESYAPKLPQAPVATTWEEALKDLDRTPDLRQDSIRAYRTAIVALRKTAPDLPGPSAVTAAIAHRFKRDYLEGTYARGKASDARKYKRAPTSCKTYLRSLRSLWAKHFKPLGHVNDNPWLDVPYPNSPRGKRVRVPEEAAVTEFFAWLTKRHPGWELPRLFVRVKMLAGCRTLDLCKVKTADLGTDSLTLTSEATKTREARTVPLPAHIVNDLRRLAGPQWLWERSLEDCKRYRPNHQTKARTEYQPTSWLWTIQNLFKEFNKGRDEKSRLRPHDLRARAITTLAIKTQNVDATAHAMGVDLQTARHYFDAAKAFSRSDILRGAADDLLPPDGSQEK